jgi:cytochrome c553
MYLQKTGDNIIVLPAQYNVSKGEWKEYFPDEKKKRNWITECAGCHSTGFDPEKKTFVEMGIGCEACHGPGNAYKSKKTMLQIQHGEIDGSKLGFTQIDEASCIRCHNQESPTYKPFDFAARVQDIAHPIPE